MHAEDISDYLIKNLHILAVKGDFAASMNGYGTNFATGNLQGTMSRVASFRSGEGLGQRILGNLWVAHKTWCVRPSRTHADCDMW